MASVSGEETLGPRLAAIGAKLARARAVHVGFLEGATYPDGTPVAEVAAINNYGAPAANVPARPFFTNMVTSKSGMWGEQFGAILKQNDYETDRALALLGEGIAGQLREEIVATNDPPLSPVTIARKGSDVPLVDTGHMLASVDKEVV